MIRDDGERTLLFDLDVAIQRLNVASSPGGVKWVHGELERACKR